MEELYEPNSEGTVDLYTFSTRDAEGTFRDFETVSSGSRVLFYYVLSCDDLLNLANGGTHDGCAMGRISFSSPSRSPFLSFSVCF